MANLKLNQFIALQKPAKSRGEGALTSLYHNLKKPDLMKGVTKTYEPREADGEPRPTEGIRIQLRVPQLLQATVEPLTRLFDLTATIDRGNQQANADIVVDDVVIVPAVPVSTLLMLEKKLVSLYEVVSTIPLVDPSVDWTWDPTTNTYKSPTTQKASSKKLPRNHQKAPATEKHPEQVEVYYEDVNVGDYYTTYFSGALTEPQRDELLAKVAKLQAAVKVAREQANMTVVEDVKIGAALFSYLGW